jgi:hypothetical protein
MVFSLFFKVSHDTNEINGFSITPAFPIPCVTKQVMVLVMGYPQWNALRGDGNLLHELHDSVVFPSKCSSSASASSRV